MAASASYSPGLDPGESPASAFTQPWGLSPDDEDAGRGRVVSIRNIPQARRSSRLAPPLAPNKKGKEKEKEKAKEQPEAESAPSWWDKLAGWAQGKPLSEKQAADIRDDLIASYKGYANWADYTISNTNRARAQAVIWETIQDDEYGILADFALGLAKTNPVIAQAVIGMARTGQLAKVSGIIGPRLGMTWAHYAQNGGFGIWMPSMPTMPH